MATSYDPSTQQQSTSWSDQARDAGRQALDQGMETAAATRDLVKDHPMATMAVIGGLAFAVGALWMASRSRQSHWPLMDRLSDLQDQIPRRWRSYMR